MTLARLLVQITAVFLAIAIVAAGYLGYRFWGAYKAKGIALREDVSGIPPVICTTRASDFRGYDVGTTSIAGGRIKTQAQYQAPQGFAVMHLYVDAQKNVFLWYEGNPKGAMFNASEYSDAVAEGELKALNISERVFVFSECVPWWNPDDSVFQLPIDVQFEAAL